MEKNETLKVSSYVCSPRARFKRGKGLHELDMAQVRVRNVAHEDPPDFEDALPFIRSPHGAAAGVINLG